MAKNVMLVAVDFSPYSEEALFFAGQLAEKLKAQLLVLHVIHDPAEAPGFYAQKGKKKKFLKSMEEAAEEMKEISNETDRFSSYIFAEIHRINFSNVALTLACPSRRCFRIKRN